MTKRSNPKSVFAIVFATALLLPAGAAVASEPTAQDLTDFERMFGIDHLLEFVSKKFDQAVDSQDLPSDLRACAVKRGTTAMTRQIESKLAQRLSHEVVAQWRDFSATGPGAKFVAFMNDGMVALAEGTPPPELASFKATLTEAEQGEIGRFVRSPSGDIMEDLHGLTDGVDPAAIMRQVVSECGVTP